MKERICKSKKNKACKTMFALSLALALLVSSVRPIEAKADDIIPSFSHLVSGAVSYACFYVHSGSFASDVSEAEKQALNKYYLFVFNEDTGEYQKKIVFQIEHFAGDIASRIWYYANSTNGGDDYESQTVTPQIYVLTSADGTGTWIDAYTVLDGGTTYASYVKGGYKQNRLRYEFKNCGGVIPIYYKHDVNLSYDDYNHITDLVYEPPEVRGNATETMWNNFAEQTCDFIGYHYVTENGATLWKEMRFSHVVYPYWEQGADGVRKLMIYAPYEQTIYMTKDVGRYVEDGIYDYYISTVERTDEHCIQPYAWYIDYQPDTSTPEKVFEVVALPYYKDGFGATATDERTLRTVYSSKSEAMNAYLFDNPPPTEEPTPTPTIIPQPTMPPLEPSDDDNIGILNFIKEWEALFNASGNFWKIMQYTFLYVPYELIAPINSIISITLALIVIRMVT